MIHDLGNNVKSRYGDHMGVLFTGNAPLSLKQTTEIHHLSYSNGKWIKLRVVKRMKSKLNMYPNVRNAEVTHSILYWIDSLSIIDRNLTILLHIYTSSKKNCSSNKI